MRYALTILVLATSLLVLESGAQAVGSTTRVSVSSAGAQADGRNFTYAGGMSADGRYVAIQTHATNLFPGDGNLVCDDDEPSGVPDNCSDIIVKDTQTGAVDVASVSSGGVLGNKGSWQPTLSADGRYVVFRSAASNLVPGDTNGDADTFIHDRQTGVTERVDVSSSGVQANDGSSGGVVSTDGRYVAFDSNSSNLVPGASGGQVYVRDRQAGVTELVSKSNSGQPASCCATQASISNDGRFVTFHSDASNLVPGDTNATIDVFRHDRLTGATVRVSVDSIGTQANSYSREASISGNGDHVVFNSAASNLVPNDTNGSSCTFTPCEDAFVHTVSTGITERVSVTNSGFQANNAVPGDEADISADGRYVLFNSEASNLVTGDTNGSLDGFVRDRVASTTTRVSVSNSGAQIAGWSNGGSISDDGRFASFLSASCSVVDGDTNGDEDVFVRDAQGATGPAVNCASAQVSVDLEDDATPANSAGFVGTVEWCRRINDNGIVDADEDAIDQITVDIVAGPAGIPATETITGFEFVVGYNAATTQLSYADVTLMIGQPPGTAEEVLRLSHEVPDSDGSWFAGAFDGSSSHETGTGVLTRLTFEGIGVGFSAIQLSNMLLINEHLDAIPVASVNLATLVVGADPNLCVDGDGDRIANGADNCPQFFNQDQANADGDLLGDECDPDDDNLLPGDIDEAFCGGDPVNSALQPERVDTTHAGVDDDGDGSIDEPLPAGSEAFECDGDGFTGTAENFVGTNEQAACAETPASNDEPGQDAWPTDFNDNRMTNTIDVGYFVPVIGTSSPGPPYNVRFDFNGNGIINTIDVGSFVPVLGKTCS